MTEKSMQSDLLSGLKILVTRPAHQAQTLCDLFIEQGVDVIRLPLIEIEALALSKQVTSIIDNISDVDFAVFISPNAVEYGLSTLLAHGQIPDKLKLVTIGKASAEKVKELLGRYPDIYPKTQYNSEALLELEELQTAQVNNKHIIIFRGQGGREHLANSLLERGARVDYIEVYQRKRPELETDILKSVFEPEVSSNCPDIITLTSNESLNNLVSLFELHDLSLQQIFNIPLVVVTEKMRENAQKIGFTSDIMIAARASNDALLESVLEWARIR